MTRRTVQPIRRALITGASSGIGEEFARQLAGRGVDLVLVARRGGALADLAADLRASADVSVDTVAADLTDAADLARVVAGMVEADPPIDLLVNNAGYGWWGEFVDQDPDDVAAMIDLNCTAMLRLAAAIMPSLRMRGTGGIINVGSVAGFAPGPHRAVYSATKAFVRSFSEALYEEARPHGVRVTLLAPGATATGFQARAEWDMSDLPKAVVSTSDQVVRAALDGFTRGKAVVVPGAINRAFATGTDLVPSGLVSGVQRLLQRS